MKWLPPLVLFVVGLVPLGLAVQGYLTSWILVRDRPEAQGRVVGYESGYHTRPTQSQSFYPVVEYRDGNGRLQTFRSKVGTGKERYPIGETVSVRYAPDAPEDGVIDEFTGLWLKPTIFLAVSLPFLLLGGVRLVRSFG